MTYDYAKIRNPEWPRIWLLWQTQSRIAQRLMMRSSVKSGNEPRFLYKYRSIGGKYDEAALRDIIVHSVLRLSSPTEFNDPFDLGAYFVAEGDVEQQQKTMWQSAFDDLPATPAIQRFIQQKEQFKTVDALRTLRAALVELRDLVGVFCFAASARNLLMWSHYASQHRGICLVFDPSEDLRISAHALRVEYRPAC